MEQLKLCLVTDRQQTRGRDLIAVVEACLAAGLPAVQVRERDLPPAELAALCRRLRPAVQARGGLLVVNDRIDVALAVGADGVQRTGLSLSLADMREIAAKRLRIGASVHSLAEAEAADEQGADWISFGPVFDTPSKRAYGPPQGLDRLHAVAAAVRAPVIAIGGISPDRVPQVRQAGAAGVAVISAILAADDPAGATRRFLQALA